MARIAPHRQRLSRRGPQRLHRTGRHAGGADCGRVKRSVLSRMALSVDGVGVTASRPGAPGVGCTIRQGKPACGKKDRQTKVGTRHETFLSLKCSDKPKERLSERVTLRQVRSRMKEGISRFSPLLNAVKHGSVFTPRGCLAAEKPPDENRNSAIRV